MEKFIDYSNKLIKPLPIKLSTFFETKEKLLDYTQCIVLYGIRRTGKTTVLNQIWYEQKTSFSKYLYISEECDIQEIMDYLALYDNIDLLLIDEITRIYGLESKIHILLDYCYNLGIKIIIAGTDSYMISIAKNNSAFGRLNLVHFVPIRFTDLKKIYKTITFDDFYRYGKTFVDDDVILSLSENILFSVEKAYSLNKSILTVLSIEDIEIAIKMILEYLIGVKSSKLPSTKLIFSQKYYDIESNIKETLGNLPKTSVNLIFFILEQLDIIIQLNEFELDLFAKPTKCNFYVTTPSIYKKLLEDYSIAPSQVKDAKLGYIFESSAISQIVSELRKRKTPMYYKFFTLRSESLNFEIDLCIINEKLNLLYLLEFKKSYKKYGKHFKNEYISELSKNFSETYCYTISSLDTNLDNMTLLSPEKKENNISRISISTFLENLDTFIK